jgi:polar amino acid transport system permease protein
MVVQIFIVYYALPSVGIYLDPLPAAILGIGLNSGAYQIEYLRSAIGSVAIGQWEAALSLGMGRAQAIKNVILPQSFRVALPALSNELVYLLKYSSIAYFITVSELVYVGKIIGSTTFMYLEVYILIAIVYVIFATLFMKSFRKLEEKLSIPGISITTTLRGI